VGEEEVSHMVNTQLHFEAILGQSPGAVHNSCVVDQDMKLVLLFLETDS